MAAADRHVAAADRHVAAADRTILLGILCCAIVLPGRKSAFQVGFWPDCYRESTEIGQAGRAADFDAFPAAVWPKSGMEGRFTARKHYCVTSSTWFLSRTGVVDFWGSGRPGPPRPPKHERSPVGPKNHVLATIGAELTENYKYLVAVKPKNKNDTGAK